MIDRIKKDDQETEEEFSPIKALYIGLMYLRIIEIFLFPFNPLQSRSSRF
jgi:hypothetical protein